MNLFSENEPLNVIESPLKITVLYDNYVHSGDTKAEWGFSCFIEGAEQTILFDTGGNPDTLAKNINALGIDIKTTDIIFISHEHWDHIGGLNFVYQNVKSPSLYVPVSFPIKLIKLAEKAGASVHKVDKPEEILPGIYSTGEMGSQIKEQSLIINTEKGLVIVTGCSHQGIIEIVQKAKEMFSKDILLVFGGFHLLQTPDSEVKKIAEEMKTMGVKRCGATHCTGDNAINVFKESFGDHYTPIGTGKVITIDK